MLTRAKIGCVALGVLAFGLLAAEPRETKLKPTFVFSGSHSGINRETFAVATDEAGWKALWEKHRGDEKTQRFTEREQYFDVNFDTHYIVAIFTPGVDGCDITPRMRNDEVVIGFRPLVYCTEGRLPGQEDKRTEHEKAKEASVSPYAFVVLPKPVKTIVIEKDVRQDHSDPPAWKEQKRFPAPKRQ
jgi:hypothetical protein